MIYYMSFAEADNWLGAALVSADDEMSAVRRAHILNINPGGEVMLMQLDRETAAKIPSRWINCLIKTKEELSQMAAETSGGDGRLSKLTSDGEGNLV